jgi:hypothetical protein
MAAASLGAVSGSRDSRWGRFPRKVTGGREDDQHLLIVATPQRAPDRGGTYADDVEGNLHLHRCIEAGKEGGAPGAQVDVRHSEDHHRAERGPPRQPLGNGGRVGIIGGG